MEQLFVSQAGRMKDRWLAAFPRARVVQAMTSLSVSDLHTVDSIWLDLGQLTPEQWLPLLDGAVTTGKPVAVLSPLPSENQAAMALARGARAYCHSEVPSGKLKEIGEVLGRGGVWLSPDFMKRLVQVSLRVLTAEPREEVDLSRLTKRELAVAEKVASGASNREISAALEIGERTVKAHLSSIFAKLGLRDRVQLALAVNNTHTHRDPM